MKKVSISFLKTITLFLLCFTYLLFTVEFSDRISFSSSYEVNFYSSVFFALLLSVWVFFLNLKIHKNLITFVIVVQVILLGIGIPGAWAPVSMGDPSFYYVVSFLFLYFCALLINKISNKILIDGKYIYILILVFLVCGVYFFSLVKGEYYNYQNEIISRIEINTESYEDTKRFALEIGPSLIKKCSNYIVSSREKKCENLFSEKLDMQKMKLELRQEFEILYKDLLQDPINKMANANWISSELVIRRNYHLPLIGSFTLCKGIPERFDNYYLDEVSILNNVNYDSLNGNLTPNKEQKPDEIIKLQYNNDESPKGGISVNIFRFKSNNNSNPYYFDSKIFERIMFQSATSIFQNVEEYNSVIVASNSVEDEKNIKEIGNIILDICRDQEVIISADKYEKLGAPESRYMKELIY